MPASELPSSITLSKPASSMSSIFYDGAHPVADTDFIDIRILAASAGQVNGHRREFQMWSQ